MREITLFWKRSRLLDTEVSPLLDIASNIIFLSYLKRTPKDVRMMLKIKFKKGKTPEDLNTVNFLELIDVHHTPESESESYMVNVRISHPLSNFNARTGGTSAAPGCKLDGEGLTYILQGSNIKLRLVAAMARLIAKPDRVSARNLDISIDSTPGPLTSKQLKLAKFAYDKGWYDAKKRVKISEMADELGIARATLAEHLSRIECIVMDDLFGSFSNFTITGADYDIIRQMVESDIESMGFTGNDTFTLLLQNMQTNMENEEHPIIDRLK